MKRNELRQMLDEALNPKGYSCVEEDCFEGYATFDYDKSGEDMITIGSHIDEIEADNEKKD